MEKSLDPNPREVCVKAIKFAVMDGKEGRNDLEKVHHSPSLLINIFAQFTDFRRFTRRSPFVCN